MILGAFLRYYKTYSGINYIPISNGEKFCGLIGNNGVGKSSVLEALDCVFNENRFWNENINLKKSGSSDRTSYIIPVFFLERHKIKDEQASKTARIIHDFIISLLQEKENLPSGNNKYFIELKAQYLSIKEKYDINKYYIIPIGLDKFEQVTLGIFGVKKLYDNLFGYIDERADLDEKEYNILTHLFFEVLYNYIYIYIPSDIDLKLFAQLQTEQIQYLLGETLVDILEKTVNQSTIDKINENLNDYLTTLTEQLGVYTFRQSQTKQFKVKKSDIYEVIIQNYFSTRKLHKRQGSKWLDIGMLSSGEKQKAIIDLSHKLLKGRIDKSANIIFAIDEPECSLHISACYDQFELLSDICNECNQLLFTTHWYGFIPAAENGFITLISQKDEEHKYDTIDIYNYREKIKRQAVDSKGKLPNDIKLKSTYDLVQSIINSILLDEPYNWLICEGSSEKIYFEKYFSDIIKEKKLRIIPAGGASEVKRIYERLYANYQEFKKEVKGKVYHLIDTDSNILQFDTGDDNDSRIIIRRMVNDSTLQKTILVPVKNQLISPKTEIEDALDVDVFYKALMSFKEANPELLSFIDEKLDVQNGKPSYFGMNLRQSEYNQLTTFFDKGDNKYLFAKKYSENVTDIEVIPEWVNEIKKFFK